MAGPPAEDFPKIKLSKNPKCFSWGVYFSSSTSLDCSTLVMRSPFHHHLTGNQDSLKREKPFYDITKFRVNLATRATDIDTNEITVSRKAPFLELFPSPAVLRNRPRNESVPSTSSNRLASSNAAASARRPYGS